MLAYTLTKSLCIHFFSIFVIIFILSRRPYKVNNENAKKLETSLLTKIHINMGLMLLLSYYLIYVGISSPTAFRIVLILFITLQWIVNSRQIPVNIWTRLKSYLRESKLIFYSIGGAIWSISPALFLSARNGVALGMETTGNNDIAMYAMLATDYLRSGFSASHHLVGYSSNILSQKETYQGPMVLTSMIASVMGLKVWQVMSIVLCFAITYGILSFNRLALAITPELNSLMAVIIPIAIFVSPIVCYISGNYFLAQIIALGISANLLTILINFRKSRTIKTLVPFELSAITVLSAFTYPHLLLPLSFGVTAGIVMTLALSRPRQITKILAIICSTVVGLLLSSLTIKNTLNFIRQTFSMTGNGWPLPFLTPQAIYFNRLWIGANFNLSSVVASWIIFLILCGVVIVRSHVEGKLKRDLLISGILLAFSIALLLNIRHLPSNNYTNWKMISYIAPIFGLVVISLFSTLGRFARGMITVTFCVLLMTPFVEWHSSLRTNTGIITADMANIAERPEVARYSHLNIQVHPWFETMAIYSILSDKQLALNNSNYIISTTEKNWCSLVRLDDVDHPAFKKLNGTYGLAQSSDKTCGLKGKANYQTVGESGLFSFSSTGNGLRMLSNGWSPPEGWGTWSDGNNSTLKFQFNDRPKADEKITLNGNIFKSPTKGQEILILVDNVVLAKQNFSISDNENSFSFTIPSQLIVKNEGFVNLQLVYSHAVSPIDIGQSNDMRRLAFGLVSMMISPQSF